MESTEERKTAWTPGPWTVIGGSSKYLQVYASAAKTNETSAFLTGWITPANAHLIAAAPQLFEALAALVQGVTSPMWNVGSGELEQAIVNDALHALAVAKGEA